MSTSLLLYLLLFCHVKGLILGLEQRINLITLMTDEGELLVLKEVRKGQEYWLHPTAVVESAQLCSSCPGKNHIILSIRFWKKQHLTSAQSLLMTKGLCQKKDPCYVGPYQAKRIILRDDLKQWAPLTSSLSLPGILPSTKRIIILPTKDSISNSSSLTPETLTAFQVSLVNSTAVLDNRRRLTISGEDLQLAQKMLKLPDASFIDGASLRKLATWILKAKTKDISAEQLSALLASLERQLTVTSMFFRPGMESLLPKGYRAKDGEQFFVRRRISSGENILLPLSSFDSVKSPEALTVGLRISENFKFFAMPTKTSVEKPVDILKRLDEQMKQVLNALNRTEYQRQALEKEVARLKHALSVTNSGSKFLLLRRQVKKLAAVTNSSHVMSTETLDLTAVDDCFEVKRRNLSAGIYFIRSLNRPVECTDEGDLVALKRDQGDVDFNASLSQYEIGLGDVRKSDYFLGLQNLSYITEKNDMCMILLFTLSGPQRSQKATYDGFYVSPRKKNYRLSYQTYKGNIIVDVLSIINRQKPSTEEANNDRLTGNCAKYFLSGDWNNTCQKCNSFGPTMKNTSSGMCCVRTDSIQGDTCSPLASVRMLLRSKANAAGPRRIIFSAISKNGGLSCSAKLHFFNVTATGLYTVTMGGASGGFDDADLSQPGGRGASIKARFFFRKGTRLAAVAGCPGYVSPQGGRGGDASWLVSRSESVLLAVAGGGGGASRRIDYSPLPGMHGRATPDGGDSWRDADTDSNDPVSILFLDNVGLRAKGWTDLGDRLQTATSGDFKSGGAACINGGGGGGGYEGGIGCVDRHENSGGGGGSLCNATAESCRITEGGNTRRNGFVIIERNLCF